MTAPKIGQLEEHLQRLVDAAVGNLVDLAETDEAVAELSMMQRALLQTASKRVQRIIDLLDRAHIDWDRRAQLFTERGLLFDAAAATALSEELRGLLQEARGILAAAVEEKPAPACAIRTLPQP